MSDTPLTDTEEYEEPWTGIGPDGIKVVRADFARELERELADCRRTCSELVTDSNAVTLAETVQRLSAENAKLREELSAMRTELFDELESSTRQGCHTSKVERDYNGQVAGTMVTDSGAISTHANALLRLAEAGRFRVVAHHGRMVVGYWPENDPLKPTS